MDVRDSPWRPPRERQSEGRGRGGKVLRRMGEKRARELTLPAHPAPAGPLAEHRRPDPDEIAPLIPHPSPQAHNTFSSFPSRFKCSRSKRSLCAR